MILQALYELCDRESLLGQNPHYVMKKISWIIRYGEKGRLLGIIDNRDQVFISSKTSKGKDKVEYHPRYIWVPREPERTSGDYAFFLCDTTEYIFGLEAPAKKGVKRSTKKLKNRQNLFKEKVKQCYDDTSDEAIYNLLLLIERVENDPQYIELPEDCDSSDLLTFSFGPDNDLLVVERQAIKKYWVKIRKNTIQQNPKMYCLVSGDYTYGIDKLPLVKKLPGGTPSGVALVSFNASAFESYGLKGNQNAAISWRAAEKCMAALNRLLDPEAPNPFNPDEKLDQRSYRISQNTTICYWTVNEEAKDFCNQFAPILSANPDEVKLLYHCIWKGQTPPNLDTSKFYALIISGVQGRAIIRDWFESTIQDTASHIARYFSDLEIVRNTPKPKGRDLPPQIPLPVLLRSLAIYGRSDEIPPHAASGMTVSAIAGRSYPMTIMHRAVERMRAEIGDTSWLGFERRDARAAIIKAVLTRNFKKEVTKEMDPHNKEKGYLLGRMLAVIERVQQEAMGDLNASVIDRYFSGASASPGSIFPRLLKNMRNHVRKIKDSDQKRGTAFWLEKKTDEIMKGVTEFPAFLPIEQQGLFILGYHHQRHDLWQKKEDGETDISLSTKQQGG